MKAFKYYYWGDRISEGDTIVVQDKFWAYCVSMLWERSDDNHIDKERINSARAINARYGFRIKKLK